MIARDRRVAADAEGAGRASEVVRGGGVVVYPTDTTYALGADAFDAAAVSRIVKIKGRDAAKKMSVLLPDTSMISRYTLATARDNELIVAMLPGPCTLLLRASTVGHLLECSDATVGVRVADSSFCQRFAALSCVPVTATSANASGRVESYSIDEAVELLGSRAVEVDLWVDGGHLPVGSPSTIIDLTNEVPKIVRHGAFPRERLQAILDRINPTAPHIEEDV